MELDSFQGTNIYLAVDDDGPEELGEDTRRRDDEEESDRAREQT